MSMRFSKQNGKAQHPGPQIRRIIEAFECNLHKVPKGIPCYHIQPGAKSGDKPYLIGVCGIRIQKVGYSGRISDMAIRKTGFSKPNRR